MKWKCPWPCAPMSFANNWIQGVGGGSPMLAVDFQYPMKKAVSVLSKQPFLICIFLDSLGIVHQRQTFWIWCCVLIIATEHNSSLHRICHCGKPHCLFNPNDFIRTAACRKGSCKYVITCWMFDVAKRHQFRHSRYIVQLASSRYSILGQQNGLVQQVDLCCLSSGSLIR